MQGVEIPLRLALIGYVNEFSQEFGIPKKLYNWFKLKYEYQMYIPIPIFTL